MSEFDAIGGAITAGLVAGAIEKPTGAAGQHHKQCADCGTETVGRFCHNCGNPSHVHRTLLHLGEELLHGVMHFDSRTWRTLPLLVFRPGRLTREWVLGKRTRYVSPLGLFLFTIFVMFMAISYLPEPADHGAGRSETAAAKLAERRDHLAERQGRLADRQAALAKAVTPEARERAQRKVQAAQDDVNKAMAKLSEAAGDGAEKGGFTVHVDGKPEWNKFKHKSRIDRLIIGNKKLDAKLEEKYENPELAAYKLQQAFYKFSFLLVPISIPFVALLFLWKRGFTLYDHGVFVLYSMTFMSMLVMVVAGGMRIGGIAAPLVWIAAPFVAPAHMFYQLKAAYGLRTFSALWRTFFLLIFSFISLTLFALAILWFEVQV